MKNKVELAFHKTEYGDGVSMRDYFAAKAMQGSLANNVDGDEWGSENISQWAYKVADAMMKERGK